MVLRHIYHEIDLEMRLSTWAKRINISILLLVCHVLFALFKILVNTREANKLKQSTAQRAALVLSVRRNGTVMLRSSAKKVVVKSQAILQSEDMSQDRMIEEVLTDMFGLDNRRDTVSRELFLGANSRKHQQLW
jgi:hypothetical protein